LKQAQTKTKRNKYENDFAGQVLAIFYTPPKIKTLIKTCKLCKNCSQDALWQYIQL